MKNSIVRVQDRLMYFIKAIGAFSPDTVPGIIYIYARGFITIPRLSHLLHSDQYKKLRTYILQCGSSPCEGYLTGIIMKIKK